MSQNLKKLSETLVKKAKDLGATAAEAMAAENQALSIEVKNQKLEKIENSKTLNLGIRVFFDYKSACVSISSANEKALDEMVLRAIAMAKEATPDEFSLPANNDQILKSFNTKNLDLYDETHENQNFEKLKELTLEMENAALESKGVTQCEGAGFGSNYSNFHFSTSNGFSNGYKKTSFQLFCSAIAGTGQSMERDYASEGRTYFHDLPDAVSIGQLAATRAVAKMHPQRPLTGSYPVLFDQRISNSLIGHLMSAINGASIARGSSWLLNNMGEKVLSDNLTLSEDPTRSRISGSRPFDSEGLPTTKKNFIEKGLLKKYILDLRSARKLKLKPLGNAYRSLSSTPQPGAGNLELSPGSDTSEDLIKNMKNGLLVTSLIGSTINQNTGDYSRGANGFWVENGEVVFPVNECTIAGNLKEMLLNIIAANDGKTYLSKVIPSLLVKNMIVAGG